MGNWLDWLNATGALVPLHYGALHTYEKWLVPIVGIGPFVVMFVVVYVVRRRDSDESDESDLEGEHTLGG